MQLLHAKLRAKSYLNGASSTCGLNLFFSIFFVFSIFLCSHPLLDLQRVALTCLSFVFGTLFPSSAALPVPGAANEQQLQQSHSQAADGPAAAAGAAVDVETCNAHAEGGEQDCGGGGKHRG